MNSDYIFSGVNFSSTYKQFVTNLAKDMGSQTMNALHAAVGISGEAGEIIDAVKKIWVYEKMPDSVYHENIIEELGDLNFYMQYLQNTYCISDEQIVEANIKKLQKRYKYGYTDEAAIARADKSMNHGAEYTISPPLPHHPKEEVKETKHINHRLQLAMDSTHNAFVTFVSSSYIDAQNFKYCLCSELVIDERNVTFSQNSYTTVVYKDTIQWREWYNYASKVPA